MSSYSQNFPINEVKEQLFEAVKHNQITILQAPPGSGKSTVLPLFFLNQFSPEKKLILVQPRRLAAKSVAERLAASIQENLGEKIGFRVRFESKISEKTVLEVVTGGILLQMLQADPFLENTGMIVFDEFHERSLNNDLCYALARYCQKNFNNELKILLMSATLDSETLMNKIPNASFVEAKGKMFPVEISHHNRYVSREWFDVFIEITVNAFRKHKEGHLLCFLPGKSEIFRAKDILSNKLQAEVYPLFGEMSLEDQKKAISFSRERKVILATNIAETSLTVVGVKVVVDSGMRRKAVHDKGLGMQKLETIFISKDIAIQRQGRAGRTANGYCYKCWSYAQEESMSLKDIPEILQSDLSSLLLQLACWGSLDLNDYDWLDFPPPKNIESALQTLELLGALHDGKITEKGKKMVELPLPVRLSSMILNALGKGLGALAVDIAVILEEKDFLQEGLTVDLEFRISQLNAYRQKKPFEGNKQLLERINQAAEKLRYSLNLQLIDYDVSKCSWLLSSAFPERIAKPLDQSGKFKLANGHVAMLPKSEVYLKADQWLVVANYNAGNENGMIFSASQTKAENHPELTHSENVSFWDNDLNWFKTEKVIYISKLEWKKQASVLNTDQLADELLNVFSEKGFQLFDFNNQHQQFLSRVESMRRWSGDDYWPEITVENIKETLMPFLIHIKDKESLKKVDVLDVFKTKLGWEKSNQLEILAPEKLKMPSGFDVNLEYSQNADLPILKVKMQEIFGMSENPKVNQGKQDVLVHLLSPRGIPVQITKDLMSFWKNTYPQVMKELRMNYPKHYWPENPLEAQAIRGIKRQNGLK
ncbi:MAG: ATP-dependent helicase HrpB [Cytophagales bacterium]